MRRDGGLPATTRMRQIANRTETKSTKHQDITTRTYFSISAVTLYIHSAHAPVSISLA